MTWNKKLALISIFLVIMIDSIGSSFILPLLPELFVGSESILGSASSETLNNLLYGLSLSSFSIAMFIGAPLMGDLSDKYGRKKTLLYCLWGTFVGYLCSAFGVILHSPVFFIFGRVIDGLTAGSLPVAQAAIIDNSSEQDRVKNLGYVLFAVSIAYVIGPILGGAIPHNIQQPLFYAALVSFINILILQKYMLSDVKNGNTVRIDFLSGFKSFTGAFQNKVIAPLVLIFMLFQLGWSCYFQIISMFMTLKFESTSTDTSIVLSLIGFGMLLSFCWLLGVLTKRFKSEQIILVSFCVIAIGVFLSLLVTSFWLIGFLGLCSAIFYGLCYPSILGMLSARVGENSQGMIMGIAGAFSALCAAISGMIGSLLSEIDINLPFVFVICTVILSIGILNKVVMVKNIADMGVNN